MKHVAVSLAGKVNSLRKWDKTYKELQKHLNTMPVGYPATLSGVERRILKAMFSVDEARLARYMSWRFETPENIFNKAFEPLALSRKEVGDLLSTMEKKGAIYGRKRQGGWEYALHPLIVGMFEAQLPVLTPSMYLDIREYTTKIFGIEYMTSAIPQLRIIPVEKSVTPEHNIATYDEIRTIIETTEQEICIAECICRKSQKLLGGSCKVTDRMESCLGFGDFGAMYIRNGWGRVITKKEALDHLTQSEKEGLIIHPSNEKKPEFICLCCGCCCGLVEIMKIFPRPADFVASNFYASIDEETCNGCGRCEARCQMGALTVKDQKAALNTGKCIGCGLCVTTCKTGSLKLVKKTGETIPPENMEEKFGVILAGKKGRVGKLFSAAGGAMGIGPWRK